MGGRVTHGSVSCPVIPWPIEYVAALAAYFPKEEGIIPTAEEITKVLTNQKVVLPGPRRGRELVLHRKKRDN